MIDYTNMVIAQRMRLDWSMFAIPMEQRIELIALVCLVGQLAKKKDPDKTCWDVMSRIGKDADPIILKRSIQPLCAFCESMILEGDKAYSTFGLKSDEIVPRLKKYIDNILPF